MSNPIDAYLEAEYSSGYVHSNQYADVSPYALSADGTLGPNIFSDILQKRPEKVHGRMVRYSLITPEKTYAIDWTTMPENARPIYAADVEQDFVAGQPVGDKRIKQIRFGYQFTNTDGKNVKEVQEINGS